MGTAQNIVYVLCFEVCYAINLHTDQGMVNENHQIKRFQDNQWGMNILVQFDPFSIFHSIMEHESQDSLNLHHALS